MFEASLPPRIDSGLLELAQQAAAPQIAQLQRAPQLPRSAAIEYDPERRVEAWLGAIQHLRSQQPNKARLPRVIFDGSHQGSGKSHSVPDLHYEALTSSEDHPGGDERRTRNLIYVSSSYRSPSIPEIEQLFVEVPSRHMGLIHAPSVDGGIIRRQITAQELRDGVRPDEPATCVFAHRLQTLNGRGFGYQEAVGSFCKNSCPHRPQQDGGDGSCLHRQSTANFYSRPDRGSGMEEPIIAAGRLRVGMQGLEGLVSLCPTYGSQSIVFIDEAPQLFDAAVTSRTLSSKRLADLLIYVPVLFPEPDELALDVFPELKEEEATAAALTEQLLTRLLQLLGSIANPHGIDHHAVRQHLAPWIEEVIATYGHGDDINLPQRWCIGQCAHTVQGYQFEQAITSNDTDPLDNLPTPLLPQLVHCVLGLDAGPAYAGHSLSITKARSGAEGAKPGNYRLTLTQPSGLPIRIGQIADAVVIGDATADPEQLRHLFSTSDHPTAFAHLKAQAVPQTQQADVLFYQVRDLGALAARERRDHQQQRLLAIRQALPQWAATTLNRDLNTVRCGFIEHKACALPGDGKWHTGSARGGNHFQHHDVIGLIGTPIKNISASLSEYVALTGDALASTGCRPEDNSPGFIRYQAQLVAAELQQAWERLRTIRRKGQQLIVVFISDADLSSLPIDVTQIAATDITPDAAHKTERKLQAVIEAIHHLANQDTPLHRISTRAVARHAGVGETTVRRLSQHQAKGVSWADFVASCLPHHPP